MLIMVLIPALVVALAYRYNRVKIMTEERQLTAALNDCPNCKNNLRMRGLIDFRPCKKHKERVNAFRRVYA